MDEQTVLSEIQFLKTYFIDIDRPFDILEFQIDSGTKTFREAG